MCIEQQWDMPKVRRRIWFMRRDEHAAETKRVRIANHISVCQKFSEELYQELLIQTPEVAEKVIKAIEHYLYWDNNNTPTSV